ncbi:DUF3558 domain-containing protein [Streptomyces sp. NA04227]|uniref:DUF3558 domain-containing protein n=1 Tax=Streptomyces sp. NA04227 TaxID=2742136 RepID=UPI001590F004|nr:DUF3558 domain-containing protein [Streptomyces sp. NA04227]QKW08385.1 DUF3558 domain-containing protein [Streptomyces sp. NA04227]
MGATGAAVLLGVLLSACSGGSDDDGGQAKPGQPETPTQVAEPGKYDSLPEACSSVDQDALDSLLPGIQAITDEVQRERAYAGAATATYDTDRRVGCRWKAESARATHHLSVDFERVVSYDAAVSDDDRAEDVYAEKAVEAGLTPAAPSGGVSGEVAGSSASPEEPGASGESGESGAEGGSEDGKSRDGGSKDKGSQDGGSQDRDSDDERANRGGVQESTGRADVDPSPEPGGDDTPTGDASPPAGGGDPGQGGQEGAEGLASRILDDLGDSAFLDDQVSQSTSTSHNRTVTVVFRTSNVIVTIQYDDQPMGAMQTPDGKEMQDRARQLADRLADKLDG